MKIDFSENTDSIAENLLSLTDDGSYTAEELVGGLTKAIVMVAEEQDVFDRGTILRTSAAYLDEQ